MSSRLIVISGPIAAGKSTVAQALAAQVRAHGESAAVIDLDVVYEMLATGPKSDRATWTLAREASATFANALLSSGVRHVVLEGEYWTESDREPVVRLSQWAPRFVTLTVAYEVALARAQADPTRRASKDPSFLAGQHAKFNAVLASITAPDIVVDTSVGGAAAIAAAILASTCVS